MANAEADPAVSGASQDQYGTAAGTGLAPVWSGGSTSWLGSLGGEVWVWHPNVCGPEPVAGGNVAKGEGEIAVGCSSPPQSVPPSGPLRLRFSPGGPPEWMIPPISPPMCLDPYGDTVDTGPRPDPALLCQASSCRRLNWLVMDLMTGLSDLTASSLLRRARTGFA